MVHMNRTRASIFLPISFLLALAAAGCTSTGPATIQAGPDAEMSFDGLHKVDNSKADLAWARPDFDLSGYNKIVLGDVVFEYRNVTNKGRSTMDSQRVDCNAPGQYHVAIKVSEKLKR